MITFAGGYLPRLGNNSLLPKIFTIHAAAQDCYPDYEQGLTSSRKIFAGDI
jgi:hypothetical protein